VSLTIFSPPVAPAPGQTAKTVTARVLRANFGDSYSQRTPDGLNPLTDAVVLDWPVLRPADADTIEAFFKGLKGATAFSYTLPWESTAKAWTAATWKRGNPGGLTASLQATLTQEFDIGT
jgi:phage-related protein